MTDQQILELKKGIFKGLADDVPCIKRGKTKENPKRKSYMVAGGGRGVAKQPFNKSC